MTDVAELDYDSVITETEQAVFICFVADDDGNCEISSWVPKKLIIDQDEDERVITVEEWFAIKEGLV